MKLLWEEEAWEDYCYWQTQDKKTLVKVNKLIKDVQRNAYEGIGEPEPLKNYDGYWSRKIDKVNRLVYKSEENHIIIASCRGHYGDK